MEKEENDKIQILVLGAGQDVGRSCALLKVCGKQILLDCGAHPGFADKRRFPDFSMIQDIQQIDAILISHFHFDHAGALPFLTQKLNCKAPVYMTKPTRELTRLMLRDMSSTSIARKQHCPFTTEDIEPCLKKVHLLELNKTTNITKHNDIAVTCYYAGHTLGAVMIYIQIGRRSILYSGDYSIKSDRHLRAATIPFGIQPDLFISEATYCNITRKTSRTSHENTLIKAILDTVQKGGKILIPVSAFGKVHAIRSILLASREANILHNVPVYVVQGLTSKANTVYDEFRNWSLDPVYEDNVTSAVSQNMHSTSTKILPDENHEEKKSTIPKFKLFSREQWNLVYSSGPMILFATPGNLSTGLSLDVFREWAPDSKNLVVVPSFVFESTVASNVLTQSNDLTQVKDSQVRCKLVNMSYESHSDARGLVRMCRRVQPRNIMLVHADKGKIIKFRDKLEKLLNIKCFAPPNNVVLDVQLTNNPNSSISNVLNSPPLELSEEWTEILTKYNEFISNNNNTQTNFNLS